MARALHLSEFNTAAYGRVPDGHAMRRNAIYEASSQVDAEATFDLFLAKYQAKYEKAAGCLAKDREALLAFYDFPAEHWKNIRSTDEVDKRLVA